MSLLSLGAQGWGDELLRGAWVTLQLGVCSLVVGLLGGLVIAALKLARAWPLRWLAEGYIGFVRGTPEFLILLLIYYGLGQGVQALVGWIHPGVVFTMPRFPAAVLGLSAIFAAYAAEVYRGAWQAVGRGQLEAARALGLSVPLAFLLVRLPQMWRHALPGLGNLWMVLLKDTSLAAVIALDDLLRQAKVASEATRQPLVFYLAAAALYLALTAGSDVVRIRLERRAQRGMVRG